MTSTTSFPDSLLIAVGDALATLPSVGANGGVDLLAQLGYKLPGNVNPAPLFNETLPAAQELSQRVEAVVNAYADGSYKDPSFAPKLVALGQSVVRVSGLLQQLIQKAQALVAAVPDYVANARLDELPPRLEGFLVATYMWRRYPLAASICELTGVLRHTLIVEGPYNPEYTRFDVRWEVIGRLVSAPGEVLVDEYKWGSRAFDSDRLFERLKGLLWLCGVRAEAIAAGDVSGVDARPSTDLDLPIWAGYFEDDNGALASISIGAVLERHVAAEAPDDAGVALTPYVNGQASAPFSVSDEWALTLGASLGAQGLQLLFHPSGISVNAKTAVTGGVSATLGRATGAGPLIPLGRDGSTHLELNDLSLTISAAVQSSGTDFGVEAVIKGLSLIIQTTEADGFLQMALGTLPPIAFDLTIGFSRSRGLYLGPTGLDYTAQVGRSVGPIFIDTVTLSITADAQVVGLSAAASGRLQFGPFVATIDQIGLRTRLDLTNRGNLGRSNLTFGFKPPNGVGLAIDAAAVTGGGYLFFDADKQQYAGVLQLELAKTIAIKAIGLLTTGLPDGTAGFSLLVVITAEGFAPLQLGFGFTLTGIGGLLSVNRTAAVDALRSGIRTGTVGSILFPVDPVRNAPRIVSDVGTVFPAAAQRYVFGPLVQIQWGTPPILRLEIGVVLEVPDPVRLLMLGRLQVVLPDEKQALVQLRMDAVGVVDFAKGDISLDATLYDSRLLAFVLTGDMALRAHFGPAPTFLLAVGGWNPRFAVPAGFPALSRLAITLSGSEQARLRLDSYLAVTSNTVQFGARADFYFGAGGFSVEGYLGFDTLFHFAPFAFIADLGASVALRAGGSVLMAVTLTMTVSGPVPWHVWGQATFMVLGFKQAVAFDARYGADPAPVLPEPVQVEPLLTAALVDARNWSGELPPGERPLVAVRALAPAAVLRVHPLAELAVRQRVAPLDLTLEKFGAAPIRGTAQFAVTAVHSDTGAAIAAQPITDAFALAQFREMSDDEKLSAPAFTEAHAGLRFTTGAIAYGHEPALDASITYETVVIGADTPAAPAPRAAYTMPAAVLDATVHFGAAAQRPTTSRLTT